MTLVVARLAAFLKPGEEVRALRDAAEERREAYLPTT